MEEEKDFKEFYNEFHRAVEDKLAQYIKVTEPRNLYEPFKYIMTGGGKRIRPVLSMICSGAVGGDPYSALDAAAAVEILHNFTLVHDDIMDKSPLRRGRETVHTKWNEPAAIITGDAMVGAAYRLLESYENHPRSADILRTFSTGLVEVCEGQAYDMAFGDMMDVDIPDYIMMVEKKTAKLIETAVLVGAYSGGCTDECADSLRKFAISLGIAFQIQDDMLDLTAEQLKLGKKIGQDILEGKKTYLILRAKEKAVKDEDVALINRFFIESGLPEESVPEIRDLFERLGIIEDAQQKVDEYIADASNAIAALKSNKYVDMLHWLLESLNKRKF
ncbi:MAG: hypothetical protein QG635_1739 [Bacteroidota bacterium]|nr:hypothetical protein [Bacteroidota bacterium]